MKFTCRHCFRMSVPIVFHSCSRFGRRRFLCQKKRTNRQTTDGATSRGPSSSDSRSVHKQQATDGATDREIDFDLQKKQANNQATDGATLFEWLPNRSVACFWVASKSLGSMASQSLGRMALWGSIWCIFLLRECAIYAIHSSKTGVEEKPVCHGTGSAIELS